MTQMTQIHSANDNNLTTDYADDSDLFCEWRQPQMTQMTQIHSANDNNLTTDYADYADDYAQQIICEIREICGRKKYLWILW